MTDLTPLLDSLLRKHNSKLKPTPRKRSDTRDEFLKEAYRINDHITSLHTYLLSIRQAYLSTSPPPRRQPALQSPNTNTLNPPTYLSPSSRDAIDASTTTLLRDLSSSIRQLSDAENLRRLTVQKRIEKKYSKGLLGRWAAGGGSGVGEKSPEEVEERERVREEELWRDSVIWYLGRKLEETGEVRREMVGRRLERGKGVLGRVRGEMGGVSGEGVGGGGGEYMGGGGSASGNVGRGQGGKAAAMMEEEDRRQIEQQLTPEQLQLFAKENQDMLKHYEDTLDQVRTAERSMLEISELQTQLVQNLDMQSANISQLVADSLSTTENVGGGNRELKRATERKSTARMVFWSSCALCTVLIGWDLIF